MIFKIFFVLAVTLTVVNCQDGHPVFHATLSTRGAVGVNTTIVFNNVPVNVEGAYGPTTGLFTCPSPGLYYFHFALKSASLSVFGGSLVVGSTILSSANTKNDGLDMVSAAGTIYCNTGDRVYVMSIAGTPEVDASYCTFTGFKLLYGPV